jgi:general secretion pathway protein D
MRLQLLEENGRVQTLARPLLLASNNEPARLFIGEEVVLTTGASAQTITGTTGASNTVVTAETEKRNIGTTLVIHPRINDDRTVTMTIDQESSERVAGGTTIPLAMGTVGNGVIQFPIDTVNTATVQAVAQAKDGLTIAVGGLIRFNKSRTVTNVPGISSIPVLRELFKGDQQVDERNELMLIITPHVLESAEEAESLSRQLGGAALRNQSISLQEGSGADPRRDARTLAELALEGLQDASPAWETDPAVRRLPVQPWSDATWPHRDLRSRLLGAWQWGRLTAVALELKHNQSAPLAAIEPQALPGVWLATALEEQPRAPEVGFGPFTRRVVLLTSSPA